MAHELDAETIAFAHPMFDLARSGATAALVDLPEMTALLAGPGAG